MRSLYSSLNKKLMIVEVRSVEGVKVWVILIFKQFFSQRSNTQMWLDFHTTQNSTHTLKSELDWTLESQHRMLGGEWAEILKFI